MMTGNQLHSIYYKITKSVPWGAYQIRSKVTDSCAGRFFRSFRAFSGMKRIITWDTMPSMYNVVYCFPLTDLSVIPIFS